MGNAVGCADCDGIMRIGSGCDCGCSVFSDSAIFLLRSMQRDECLIPIRASKNVHSEVKEKKRVLGDYQSLQSFDIREFSFTSQIVQFFRNSSTAKKPKTT